jgi:hypothetical protein
MSRVHSSVTERPCAHDEHEESEEELHEFTLWTGLRNKYSKRRLRADVIKCFDAMLSSSVTMLPIYQPSNAFCLARVKSTFVNPAFPYPAHRAPPLS